MAKTSSVFEDAVQTQIVTCRLCNGSKFRDLFSSDNIRKKTKRYFTVVQCESCGFKYVNPMPTNESLMLYYHEYEAHEPKKIGSLEKLYYRILRNPKKHKTPGKALDIGCGNGKYLTFLRDQGWETVGLDRGDGCRFPREVLGHHVLDGEIWEQNLPDNSFDLITSWWMIEHVLDPRRIVSECHRILKPGGELIISTMNVNSMESRIFKRFWWHLVLPEHISQFDPASFRKLVEDAGFEVFHFRHEPVTCGFIGSIQNYLDDKGIRLQINNIFFKLLFIPVELIFALFRSSGMITLYAVKRPTN